MLTKKQERFCELVALYGLNPAQAAKAAGYACINGSGYGTIGRRLVDSIQISSRIAEIRDSLLNPESVRQQLILGHHQTRRFKVSDYVHSVQDVNANGVVFNRIVVKPYEEWDEFAKSLCVGFDRYGIPIFKNKEKADNELARLLGLYKDVTPYQEEDTSAVLAGAGLFPSGIDIEDDADEELPEGDWDGVSFDKELDGQDSVALTEKDLDLDKVGTVGLQVSEDDLNVGR